MQIRGFLVFKDDGDGERVVTRRLITQATNWYQLVINKARPTVYRMPLTFRRRIKSRLPFAGIIRRLPYSTRFQDKG